MEPAIVEPAIVPWIAVLAPAAVGAALTAIVGPGPRQDLVGYVGRALCVGPLCVGLIVFAARWCGVDRGWWPWLPPLLLAPLLVSLLVWRRPRCGIAAPAAAVGMRRPTWPIHLATAIVALSGVWAMLTARDVPLIDGDEANIWSMQAKTLYLFSGHDYTASQAEVMHSDYPKLNPILQAWVYSLQGGIGFYNSRLPIQLVGVGMLLVLASALRRLVGNTLAAGLVLLVASDQVLQRYWSLAGSDIMIAAGLLLALDGWLRIRDAATADERRQWIRWCALGWTLALWSKNEAMLFALAAATSMAVAVSRCQSKRRSDRRSGSVPAGAPSAPLTGREWIALGALPVVAWAAHRTFNAIHGLYSDLLGDNPAGRSAFELFVSQFGERVPAVAEYAALRLIDPTHAQGVWLAVWGVVIVAPRALGRSLWPIAAGLLLTWVGFHGVYVGSWIGLERHLDTSYSRVMFQGMPCAVVLVAAALASHWIRGRREPSPEASDTDPDLAPRGPGSTMQRTI